MNRGPLISIFGAVREEISGVRRQIVVEESGRLGRADFWSGSWEGKQVALVRTGIGKQRAREAVVQMMQRFSPSMVVSTGYAGGVDSAFKVGDLLLADKVLELPAGADLESRTRQSAIEFYPDPGLLGRARQLTFDEESKLHIGGLLTVQKVVSNPLKKQQLGLLYPVRAVDMETSAIAKAAQEHNVPFLSVRAISDSAEQELLDVSSFMEDDGRVSNLKAGWYVLTHPGSLKNLNHMRVHARRATDSLTRFLSAFLKTFSTVEGNPEG